VCSFEGVIKDEICSMSVPMLGRENKKSTLKNKEQRLKHYTTIGKTTNQKLPSF